MTRCLISFDHGEMDRIPDEEGHVASHEDALEWAAKIAVACRCAQEFREIMPDRAVGN
jgi:hypothetical protein